jgi:branched-chain amino acid aminotransferase
VSVFDHGLTVGDGVFETLKAPGRVPFAMRRHIERLVTSAERMGLRAPDHSAVAKACRAVVDAFEGEDARVRITYTGGAGPLGSARGDGASTLVVAAVPLDTRPAEETIAVVLWARNERGALAGVKSTSYGENVVALARAKAVGGGEAVFPDTTGRLSEGTGSNVFVVVDGRVLTPALDAGCLAGVTRALVLEWSDAQETDVPLEVLDTADEVFLTSTTRDVQPVTTIVWPDDRRRTLPVGPVTAALAETFTRRSQENPEP